MEERNYVKSGEMNVFKREGFFVGIGFVLKFFKFCIENGNVEGKFCGDVIKVSIGLCIFVRFL